MLFPVFVYVNFCFDFILNNQLNYYNFSSYEELINKRKVAVKCINVTKSYSMMKISSMKKGLKLTIALEEILGVTLSEAVTQDKIQEEIRDFYTKLYSANDCYVNASDHVSYQMRMLN